jgi:Protein of unknown function (DUF3575)
MLRRIRSSVLLLVVGSVASSRLHAQAAAPAAGAKPVTQVVSISPISLVFGAFGAEYERRINPSTALAISGTYYRPEVFWYSSVEAKYRYYPQERALEGFAVGVTAGLTQIGTHDRTNNESGSAVAVGFALDYQWLLGPKKHFAVTLGSGARRLISIGDRVNGAAVTLPTFRISIGRGF